MKKVKEKHKALNKNKSTNSVSTGLTVKTKTCNEKKEPIKI